MRNDTLGIYIHIPFCVRKCNYCDFLSAPASPEVRKAYVDELTEEIKYKAMQCDMQGMWDVTVDSVYIGGGTPSILSGEEIGRIMDVLGREFDIETGAEISMEINPGTLDNRLIIDGDHSFTNNGINESDIQYRDKKIENWKKAGINRLSIGLQSTRNEELKILGRIHNFEIFEENFHYLREKGFENLNIDLMSALPGQTKDSWAESLEKVACLKPEHISAYSLIIEENTPFYEKYREDVEARQKGEKPGSLPDENTEVAMYEMTADILSNHGFKRYEISNFARERFECRHNIRYWKRGDYLGFGIGAASLLKNKRYKNISDLNDYLGLFTKEEYLHYKNLYEETTELDTKAQMEEFMFLGLRMRSGISVEDFNETFNGAFEEIYGDIFRAPDMEGLLEEYKPGWWRLTPGGVNISNYVLAKMLL